MTKDAPRSFNQHIFFDAKGVYYGTDDGFQDDSMGEFEQFERLYASVAPARREQLHFVGAVGGLYSLNLMTCFRPSKITFFDINPHAIAYFRVIRRVFQISASKQEFLARLSNEDFEVDSEAEALIRENLALKQRNELSHDRASPYKRSLAHSWQYALDRYELTRSLLSDVPLDMRVEGIHSEAFTEFLRSGENIWLYCSNIAEFTYSELRFAHPRNAVVTAIIYPGQVDILDLAPFGDAPVTVHCTIPMGAARDDEPLIDDPPPPGPDTKQDLKPDAIGAALAARCQAAGLPADGRILDVGCGWGRLALGLRGFLVGDGAYEGFDPAREQLRWAKEHISAADPRFTFHIANIRNRIYNPAGTLDPLSFRFPYHDDSFDMVVIHELATYLLPEQLVHVLDEARRVLRAGGKLLLGACILDARSRVGPHPFRFADDQVASTRPHRAGKLAYELDWLQHALLDAVLVSESFSEGAWSGAATVLSEDLVVAIKPALR